MYVNTVDTKDQSMYALNAMYVNTVDTNEKTHRLD